MKEGWEIKKLGDIGKVSMCKRILKKQTLPNGDIPFYKIGTFGKTANAFISRQVYEEYRFKYSFPKKGDILLSASGTIGRRVIYDGQPAYFQDSNIVWIDNDEKQVLNSFLYKFYGYCDWDPTKGATISRLYNDDLRRIEIPLPPLPEQQRIVSILDECFTAIDKAKANAEKNLQNAKELFESYLQGVFERRSLNHDSNDLRDSHDFKNQANQDNPKNQGSDKGDGWDEKTLGEVCLKTSNIKWSDSNGLSYDYIDLSAVSRDDLKILETVKVNSENAPSRAKKIVKEGDIIFATTRPTLKRLTLISEEYDNQICSTGFTVLRPNAEKVISSFIFYSLLQGSFMTRMESLQRGASYPAVTDSDVKGFIIPVPKIEEQKEVINQLDYLRAETQKLETLYQKKIAALDELKKSILQRAFEGELVESQGELRGEKVITV